MARSNSKPSNSALELPDPYGQGFERIEDPLEKTRVQWIHLEGRRKLFGGIAHLGAYLLAVYSWSSASIHWHAWHIFPRADCRKKLARNSTTNAGSNRYSSKYNCC